MSKKFYVKNGDKYTELTPLQFHLQKLNMSQSELARQCGLGNYQVSQLATGIRKDCLISTAKKICRVLNCKLDDIFGD